MARQRLTTETLDSLERRAAAREHIRLAEAVLGPSASDAEVLAAAQRFAALPPEDARRINKQRQVISAQTRRLGAFDGAEDPWDESGPEQPDPTNNQAYTKKILTTPDHAVQDSLQKRDIHAPTASRARLNQIARRKRAVADEHDEEIEDKAKKRKESPSNTEMEELGNLGRPGVGRESAFDDDIDEDILPEGHEPDDEDLDDDTFEHDEHDDDDDNMGDDVGDDVGDDIGDDIDDADDGMLDDDTDTDDDFHDMEDGGDPTGFGLDQDDDALDDLLGLDEGGPDALDGMDDDHDGMDPGGMDPGGMDDDHDGMDPGMHFGPETDDEDLAPPRPIEPVAQRRQQANRRSSRRQASSRKGQRQAGVGRSGGESSIGLDDILNIHDEDIERQVSTPLANDDLQSLLGQRVERAGNRVSVPGYGGGRRSAALENRRAMLECVWDTEAELYPERTRSQPARKQASTQSRKRGQNKKIIQPFVPDRRRASNPPQRNEWDQVFGVPDVSKYFE